MGFRLKPNQENFTITDGPLAGMNYAQGVEYPHVPNGYEDRFEPVPRPDAVTSTSPPKPTPQPASKPTGSNKTEMAKATGAATKADAVPNPSKTKKDNDK